jgi:hypothetical protein
VATTHRAPRAPRRRQVLVVGLAALGPTTWAAHLLLSYWFVPVSCEAGTTAPMHAVTVAAVTVIVVTLLVAAGAIRNGGVIPVRDLVMASSLDGDEQAARRALPRLAVLLAVYFALVVVVTGLVAVVVDPCA